MTLAVDHPSSSSSLTSSTSSSSTPDIQFMSDSNSTDKSLKRKRSSSFQQLLSSNYPTPSPPESFEAVFKTEEQEQEQGLNLKQKQDQELHSKQEPDDYLSSSTTLPNDAHTTFLTQTSTSLPFETSVGNSDPGTGVTGITLYESKDQGTQTEVELPETEHYFNWSGRGRPPFNTPATAALDGVRQSAKFVQWLERDTVKERIELEKAIRWKKYCWIGVQKARIEVQQDRMDPLKNVTFLAKPVDQYEGKSNSPDKYIAKMRVSIPPVNHQYMETYKLALPKQMHELLGLLGDKLGEACIPLTYEAEIKRMQPNGLRTIPRPAFGAMETRSEISIEQLCDKARDLVENNLACFRMNTDENGWGMEVVLKALEWETSVPERKSTRTPFSLVQNIQSQLLAKSCRQTYNGKDFETKKTDWALSFSWKHPQIQRQYETLASDGHPPALSQMNQMSTSNLVLYSATEVKVTKGREKEGQAQLFTWFQAGVTRLRKLLNIVGSGTPTAESTLPLLGWTVVGERWELYMAIGEGNEATDPVLIIGPFRECQCDTTSFFGVFKLLQLMERVKDWARDVYWPWYCETVIEPLKLLKGQPRTQEEKADETVDKAEREELESDGLETPMPSIGSTF